MSHLVDTIQGSSNVILTIFLVLTATIASNARCSLESIIAISVICGWPTTKNHITVVIVGFAVLVGLKTFNTVMTVECVSTKAFTPIIIAKVASTNRTARFARNSSLVPEVLRTKCLVDTPFTGNAFGSWRLMTPAARYVKRRPRRRIA